MFENLTKFFKKLNNKNEKNITNSRDAAKERLHLVLMQDRANVSADFLELMKQEIIDVIKKYIEVDENAIDVRLTNKENEDGTNGAPALYANIPILNIKNEARKIETKQEEKKEKVEDSTKKEEKAKENKEEKKKEQKENKEKDDKKEEIKKQKEKTIEKEEEKKEEKKQQTQKNKEEKVNKEDTKEELKSEK